jgi:hypothetical protein
LDAADSSTITLGTGTAITAWRDKSANAFTGTLVNSPTYSSNALNGRPAVSFNGTNQYINFGNNLNIGTSQIHVFAVLQYNSTADGAIIGKTSFRANAGRWALFRSAADGGLGFSIDVNGSGVGATARLADTNTTSRIVYGAWDRSVVSLLQTGVTLNSAALVNSSSLSNTDPLYIGAYPNSTGSGPQSGLFFNGIMGEVIVYLGNVSPSQREQIEGYLAWKWGFVRQSASSPSASFLPTSISNCALWLDAADSNTISFVSGSSISQWSDKSGNNKHAIQNVTGRYPTYSSNSVNGLSSVQTSSAGTTMFVPSLALTFPPTVIAVIQKTGTGGLGAAFIEHGPNTNSNSGFYMTPINSDFFSVRSPTGEQQFLDAAAGQGVAAFNATGVTYAYFTQVTPNLLRVNKTTRTTTSTKNTGNPTGVVTDQLNIGSRNQTSLLGDARYCEIILYNRNITLSEILEIETYLTLKWGIAESLSSNHPYTNILPVTRPFVPLDIPDCALWLDGADPSTLTLSGSNVTQWNDKSGNGRNTSAVSGTPVLSTSSLSRRGVYFNGTSYFTGPFSYSSNTLSWFVVGTVESDGETFGRMLSLGAAGTFDFDSALRINAVGREAQTNEMIAFRNNVYIARGMNISYTTPFMISDVLNGTSNFPFINGTAATGAATSGNFGFTTYGISGSFGTNIQRNKGFIFEVLIYTGALSTSERQQVEGYLSRKWGLVSSLPTIHDFKGVLPATAAFNPRQISNCALWLDAADTYSLTLSGSNVSQWRDKVSNVAFNTQGTLANITLSNRLNGLQSIYFNNSASDSAYMAGTFSNIPTGTAFYVFRASSQRTVGWRAFLAWRIVGVGGQFPAYGYLGNTTVDTVGPYTTSASPNGTPTQVLTPGSNYVISYGWSGTSTAVTTNGSTVVTGSQQPYSSSSTTCWIGSDGIHITLDFGEIILYSRNLSTSERQQVEGYLSSKWGLQNSLPSTHPYKKISPI